MTTIKKMMIISFFRNVVKAKIIQKMLFPPPVALIIFQWAYFNLPSNNET